MTERQEIFEEQKAVIERAGGVVADDGAFAMHYDGKLVSGNVRDIAFIPMNSEQVLAEIRRLRAEAANA